MDDASDTDNARYFNNAALSDVTIHFNDDEELELHRVILASSSEHFRKMFESGFAESSSKDVRLIDDDPEALYGLLAWCYGLLYDGKRTFGKHIKYKTPNYYGSSVTDEGHLTYMANLYVAADKYMVPKLKEHARDNWRRATIRFVERYENVLTEKGGDKFMGILEPTVSLIYNRLGESAKELRPYLVKALHEGDEVIADLVENERFKELMVKVPDLACELVVLGNKRKPVKAYKDKSKSKQPSKRASSESSSDSGFDLSD